MKILHRFTGEVIFEFNTRSWKVIIKAALEAKANLRSADLSYANLRSANLSYANLRYADLSYADLRSANLDFSAFPFRCGSFDIEVDVRLSAQLAYHFCRLDASGCEDAEEIKAAQASLKVLANKFHRVGECGVIK